MTTSRPSSSSALCASALLVASAILPAGALSAQAPVAGPEAPAALVDALFERWHRPDSPGAAVLVLLDGQVVHSRGYGMANLEHGIRIHPGSVFDVASVSKQFGAFAIALLEADGLVAIDDPVHRYIPELADFGHPITLRHLVHHLSGIRDWPGTLAMAGWDYQDIMSFDQILRMAFHQRELNFEPGSEHAYSNTGYNLLAEVVARVSGMSFREFTQERIFAPLGMTATHFQDDHGEVVANLAYSYRRAPDGGFRTVGNALTALGSSSLHSSIEDLAKWVGNFGTGRVGGAEVVARMHERGVLTAGDTIPYAWGQSLGEYRGIERWSHTGSWAGYRTLLHRYPGERAAVIVLANTSDMNPAGLADRIADIYLGARLAPPAPDAPAPAAPPAPTVTPDPWTPAPAALAEYAGEYWSGELLTGYRLELRDGALVAVHFRTGERTLRPLAPDRFQAPTFGELRFLRGESGEVIGFTANQARIRGLRFDRVR